MQASAGAIVTSPLLEVIEAEKENATSYDAYRVIDCDCDGDIVVSKPSAKIKGECRSLKLLESPLNLTALESTLIYGI